MASDVRLHARRVVEALTIGVNTLVCALVFAPWVLPRETVSGLLGRWSATGEPWQRALAEPAGRLVDMVCWWDPNHCSHTYECERQLRLMRKQ